MAGAYTGGVFGKIPSKGDFISFGLPRRFTDPWESVCRTGLDRYRQHYATTWIDTFLVAPISVFSIALYTDEKWVGVVIPSVDKVNRYFPLLLARNVSTNLERRSHGAEKSLYGFFSEGTQTLLDALDVDRFDMESWCAHVTAVVATPVASDTDMGHRISGWYHYAEEAGVGECLVDDVWPDGEGFIRLFSPGQPDVGGFVSNGDAHGP